MSLLQNHLLTEFKPEMLFIALGIAVRRRVLFRTFFHDFFVQQMALTMILTLQ